ncbi:MAG: type IV pilin N-terminal domain-containing protein [Candidatus Methanoperedens sp.]|nr:type IV pilin N-terminal domain-containing protein [Candidatus Methanoperedens sp.]
MKKLWKNDGAVSSVIGVILMVGMTVIMISVVAMSVMGFALPESAPQAKIVLVEAMGGMNPVTLNNNIIALRHKGGDELAENNTKIIIKGRGYAYTGTQPDNTPVQDIIVIYNNLKGTHYDDSDLSTQEDIVIGDTWSAGETATLRGRDGQDNSNTCKQKYWLEAGSTVSVTIIDTTTNEVIAVSQATVKNA